MKVACARVFVGVAFGVAFGAAAIACGAADLVIGDDTSAASPDGAPATPDASPRDDATLPDDATPPDPPPPPPPSPCVAPATCIASTSACHQIALDAVCAAANTTCCAVGCPNPTPPPPTLCDGGPIALRYNPSTKCTTGYACAPTDCAGAGGQCVGVAPGTCPSGNVGDATKYSCGGGIGTLCCLP